jgi:hypothetical protein
MSHKTVHPQGKPDAPWCREAPGGNGLANVISIVNPLGTHASGDLTPLPVFFVRRWTNGVVVPARSAPGGASDRRHSARMR